MRLRSTPVFLDGTSDAARLRRLARAARVALLACASGIGLASGLVPGTAQAQHVHGQAQMRVVQEAERLDIELVLPLDTVVGFERAPRGPHEEKRLREALAALREARGGVVPSAPAQCALVALDVQDPAFGDADGHVDVVVRWRMRCAAPQALSELRFVLFETLGRLKRVETSAVTARGQRGARLTRKDAMLKL